MLKLISSWILVFFLVPLIPAFAQNASLINDAKKEGGKVIAYAH
jgi:hypothetical protein